MIKHKTFIHNRAQGFTIVELMVALAIAAILMSYGIPSYYDFSIRQKLTGLTNELIGDLNYTRIQAINQGTTVTLSAVGGNWNNGWSIDQTLPDNTTQQLRVKQVIDPDTTYTISGTPAFVYDSLGSATTSGSVKIGKTPEYPGYTIITVSPSGAASSSKSL